MDDREPINTALELAEGVESSEFEELIGARMGDQSGLQARTIEGVVVGTLVGFNENGTTPLVTYRGQPGSAALPARATVDLYGRHIGRDAVLVFEKGDPRRPIIVGCLHETDATELPSLPGHVEVEADGKRLVISAQDQIVLRCGKASITLAKEGKLIIQGAYVSSQSSGVLRIKGGSVQIN
jgi:hypothetical protein